MALVESELARAEGVLGKTDWQQQSSASPKIWAVLSDDAPSLVAAARVTESEWKVVKALVKVKDKKLSSVTGLKKIDSHTADLGSELKNSWDCLMEKNLVALIQDLKKKL